MLFPMVCFYLAIISSAISNFGSLRQTKHFNNSLISFRQENTVTTDRENKKSVNLSNYSFVERSFKEENHKIKVNEITRDVFACPAGSSYLSYYDALKNQICSVNPSRLQGGASSMLLSDVSTNCTLNKSDIRPLKFSTCAQSQVQNIIKAVSEDCPEGYSRISFDEVNANKNKYCNMLEEWDIARIGIKSSLGGSGYNCILKEWDYSELGHSICINKIIQNIQVVATNETICGFNMTLFTVEEALANREDCCDLIPYWGIARLAGGGSMDGEGYGCQIRDQDRRSLGHAICGPNNRS